MSNEDEAMKNMNSALINKQQNEEFTISHQKMKSLPHPDASTLRFKIRQFFLNYTLFFIFSKIFIGALFIIVPYFLFRRINAYIESQSYEQASNDYIYAFIPLIVSVSMIILFYLALIVNKLFRMCNEPIILPTWEFRNIGKILFYFVISIGVLLFIFDVDACLNYLEPYHGVLLTQKNSLDVMNAVLARIILNNFDLSEIVSSNTTAKIQNRIYLDNDDKMCNNFIKNPNCKSKLNFRLNTFDSYSLPAVPQTSADPENVMIESWGILFTSILIMIGFSLFKIIFFKVKNIVYYALITLSALYFYLITIINIKMNQTMENLHKLSPVYIILLTLIFWSVDESINFIKKSSFKFNSEKSDEPTKLFIHNPFIFKTQTYNWVEKLFVLSFDISLIISYILFIIVLSLTIAFVVDFKNGTIDVATGVDRNELIDYLASLALYFFLIGNVYKLGNLIITPLFYSIEKRFFSAPMKPFYYKLLYTQENSMSPNLFEIKKFYTAKRSTIITETPTMGNLKTSDIEVNEEERGMLKVADN